MMVYRAFRNNRKRRLKLVHMSLNLLAFIIAVVALQAAFDSHNNKKIPNIYSLHSWLGLCAVIIFAAQWVFGFVAFLFPELNASTRSAMMPVHIFFGLFAFVLSVATALIGLTEKAIFVRKDYADLPSEGLLINFIGIVLVVFATLVIYIVTESRFKRHSRPEDEILLTGNME
uniref:Cytochrome b561 domain-containing protein n=1 Tax=Timema shepardi TaxID=629360 RepID=A0A7R9B6P0_TIMSH|nr:unnamed protein product [Timema shepardi]